MLKEKLPVIQKCQRLEAALTSSPKTMVVTEELHLPLTLPGPAPTVDKQDTRELTAPLCLDRVGYSPQVPPPQETLSDPVGLAAEG